MKTKIILFLLLSLVTMDVMGNTTIKRQKKTPAKQEQTQNNGKQEKKQKKEQPVKKKDTTITTNGSPTTRTTTDTPTVKTYCANGVSFTMVYVEGGTFTMGANWDLLKGSGEEGSDAYSNEDPAHQVTLSSYSIGETEVTQALWEAVMGETVSQIASREGWYTVGDGDNYPMYYISWKDCQTFIRKLNTLTGKRFRLPTEAEWEYAARGGSKSRGYKYAGGNSIDDVAWYSVNCNNKGLSSPDFGTHPVKGKRPNELGLYDMSGNVCEWCSDRYGRYGRHAQTNPTGANSGSYRVIRGGSCYYCARDCRVSYRYFNAPSFRNYGLGFRLALSE